MVNESLEVFCNRNRDDFQSKKKTVKAAIFLIF